MTMHKNQNENATNSKLESIITSCVNEEMDEGCHLDSPKDYDSYLEFYLSNVAKDSYISYILDVYDINKEEAEYIQSEVKQRIIDKVNELNSYNPNVITIFMFIKNCNNAYNKYLKSAIDNLQKQLNTSHMNTNLDSIILEYLYIQLQDICDLYINMYHNNNDHSVFTDDDIINICELAAKEYLHLL